MDAWTLIESYFKDKSFVDQEIASFNQFVEEKLSEILEENKVISPKIEEVHIELSNIEVLKPRIIEVDGSPRTDFYPMEARLRNKTYSGPIFLTMRLMRRDVEQDVRRTYVGELPVMLKSKLCWLNDKTAEELIEMGEDPLDFGGYFIINGSEKALITQEVLSSDRVMISKNAKGEVSSEVISTKGAFKGRVRVTRKANGLLEVVFPASPKKLMLFDLMKALGLTTKDRIGKTFTPGEQIANDILLNWEDSEIKTEEEALDRIGKSVAPGQIIDYRLRRAQEVIDGFLLPHIGQEKEDRLAKAYYLGMMASKAIERAYGLREEDDKDHYANKRLELSGKLMEHLFRYAFKYLVKDLKFQIDRTITRRRKLNISTIIRPDAITERIRFAMATGNWIGRATGVSKFMDRVNYLSPLTDLRKVKSSLNKSRELYEARDVHGTHWGRVCPIETPDGPACVTPNTEILLNDYSYVTMQEFEQMWKDNEIASVDWASKEEKNANIVRFIKFKPKNKVFKVKTSAGKEITATEDHPFYSERLEKTELKNLQVGDRIATIPTIPLKFEAPTGKTIISEKELLQACPEKSKKKIIIDKLKEKNLANLKDCDNGKILAIARLVGHLFGDGYLSIRMRKYRSEASVGFTGNEGELKEITKDLIKLGFKPSKITKRKAVSKLESGQISDGYTTRMLCYSKPLFVLMKALGVPVGRKTDTRTRVPDWIKKQRKIVIREFLAAYFGSELTKPAINKGKEKRFLQPAFSLNKSRKLLNDGIGFVKDIEELLERFDIRISKVRIVFGRKRKHAEETRKIKVMLSSSTENLINLYGKISYAYNLERKSLARAASQYLYEKKHLIQKRTIAQKQAIILYSTGKGVKEIAAEMPSCVKQHDVANWIKKDRKGKQQGVKVSAIGWPTFNEWLQENLISENALCWERIESIEETECEEVMDVTTLQDYHNFFANNLLTGNCGLTKNLSLMAKVTTESKEEPVEELIKKLGVGFR